MIHGCGSDKTNLSVSLAFICIAEHPGLIPTLSMTRIQTQKTPCLVGMNKVTRIPEYP